jgi:hypothetical protein
VKEVRGCAVALAARTSRTARAPASSAITFSRPVTAMWSFGWLAPRETFPSFSTMTRRPEEAITAWPR